MACDIASFSLLFSLGQTLPQLDCSGFASNDFRDIAKDGYHSGCALGDAFLCAFAFHLRTFSLTFESIFATMLCTRISRVLAVSISKKRTRSREYLLSPSPIVQALDA